MKKVIKSILTLLLAASFIAMSVTPVMAAPRKTIDYVAFGDSVAAGVRGGQKPIWDPNYETSSEYGYTNIIAKNLENAGLLGNFNKNYAESGATTASLLEELNDAVKGPEISQLIENAEIVTLDIGANDLLLPLYSNLDPIEQYCAVLYNQYGDDWYNHVNLSTYVNPILSQIIADLYYGPAKLDIQHNIETILQKMLNANKNVKIYVMGYYNPLPKLSAAYGVDLYIPTMYFNTFVIRKAIYDVVAKNNGASITYVETMAAMAINSNKNLVPMDIHPTEVGYKVIANEFWRKIKLNLFLYQYNH